jgi:hypothetical protein
MHATPLATVASAAGSILSTGSQVNAREYSKILCDLGCFKQAAKLSCMVKGDEVVGFQAREHFGVVRAVREGQSSAGDGCDEVPVGRWLLFICFMVQRHLGETMRRVSSSVK